MSASRLELWQRSWDGVALAGASHEAGSFAFAGIEDVFVSVDLAPGVLLRHRSEGRTRSAYTAPDRIHVLPPRASSRWSHDQPVGHLQLTITVEAWQQASSMPAQQLRPAFGRLDPLVARDVRQLWHAKRSPQADPLAVSSLLAGLAGRLEHRRTEAPPRPDGATSAWFAAFEELVDDSLHLPLRVGDLAEATGLRSADLLTRVRTACGVTPYQYVVARRVARAQRLLRDDTRSLAETATLTGFYDQAHLTRHFTRLVGAAPAAYRRALHS